MKAETSQEEFVNTKLKNKDLNENLSILQLYKLQSKSHWYKFDVICMQNYIGKRQMVRMKPNSHNSMNSLSCYYIQQQTNKIKYLKDIHYHIWCLIAKEIPNWTQVKNFKNSYFNSIDLSSFYPSLEHCKNLFSSNLQQILLNIVTLSKDFPEVAIASSNAITILNNLGHSLNNKDLQSINAPYADFSHTSLININFKNSNLSSAKFLQSHLYQVDFTNCNLENAIFSLQKPFINSLKIGKYFDISPCGKYFAGLGLEGETVIRVWELGSDRLIKEIQCKEDTDKLSLLRFSPCGSYICTIKFGVVTLYGIWNDSLEIKFEEFYPHVAFCFAFSPCKTYIAAGSHKKIRIWDIKTQNLIYQLCEHEDRVAQIAFSLCSRFLYSISYDSYIFVWEFTAKDTVVSYYKNGALKYNRKKARRLKRIKCEIEDEINSLIPSKCGRFIFVGGKNFSIWSINLCERIFRYNSNNYFGAIFNMLNTVAFRVGDDAIMTLDIETQNSVYNTFCHTDTSKQLVFLPEGKSIAITNGMKAISILEISHLNCSNSADKCINMVNCIAFSPCGLYFVTHSGNALIELWEVKSHKIIKRIDKDSPNSAVKVILYSPNGSYIVTPKNISIYIYSPDLNYIQESKEDAGYITALAISPDERYIISGSLYKQITLWEIKDIKKPIEKICNIFLSERCTNYLGFSKYKEMTIFYEHVNSFLFWSIEKKKHIDVLKIQSGLSFINQASLCNHFLAYITTNPSNVFIYNFDVPQLETITPLIDIKKCQDPRSQWKYSNPLSQVNSSYTMLKFSPSGAYFAALWIKNTGKKFISEIHIWQAESKEFLTRIKESANLITYFEFSPCENIICITTSNLTIKFWDWKFLI